MLFLSPPPSACYMMSRSPFFTYRIDVMPKAHIVDLLAVQIIQFPTATFLSIYSLVIKNSCARTVGEFSQIQVLCLRFCLPH
jgi:hypothetical protein